MIKLIKFVLLLFDNYQSKKILSFIKLKLKNHEDKNIFFDIGAHKGETCIQFLNKFNFKQAHVFEPEPETYNVLEKNIKNKFKDVNIHLNNFALGEKNTALNINSTIESSSTTIHDINENTDYFLRKKKVLGLSKNEKFFVKKKINMVNVLDYIEKNKLTNIDVLKIDTEGYEYYILKSFGKFLKNVKIIYFEHHYDLMIKKGYFFSDISKLLLNLNFEQGYKHKMYFRKSFEYIYINKNLL